MKVRTSMLKPSRDPTSKAFVMALRVTTASGKPGTHLGRHMPRSAPSLKEDMVEKGSKVLVWG